MEALTFVRMIHVPIRQDQGGLHFVWVLHAHLSLIAIMAIVIVTMELMLVLILLVLMLHPVAKLLYVMEIHVLQILIASMDFVIQII
jgi:hypothetical protein